MVPEPSARTTKWMARAGSFRAGFNARISGASHCVVSPRKIRASTSPDSRIALGPTFERFTTGTTPVMTVGNMTKSFFFRSALLAMTSDAPKSTSRLLMRAMPAPEPAGSYVSDVAWVLAYSLAQTL